MKKALALMLALMMTAAMGVTSFADIPVIDLTEDIGSASGAIAAVIPAHGAKLYKMM